MSNKDSYIGPNSGVRLLESRVNGASPVLKLNYRYVIQDTHKSLGHEISTNAALDSS